MLPVPVFYAILALCCVYAALKGGKPEQVGAGIFVLSSVASTIVASSPAIRFGSVEIGVFLVDTAMLLALTALALRAERLWPLWVTALQAVEVAGHAVKLIDSNVIRLAYAFILALWAYPMLLLLVLGTWNHQRRVARFGADRSWSSSSDRWDRRPPDGPTAWSPNSDRSPPL